MRPSRSNSSRDEARRARERARDLDPSDARGAFRLLGDTLRGRDLPDYETETAVTKILESLDVPSEEKIALLLEALQVRHRRVQSGTLPQGGGRTAIEFQTSNGFDVSYFGHLREGDRSDAFDDSGAPGWSTLGEIGGSGFDGGFIVLDPEGQDAAYHDDRSVVRLALDFLLRPERLEYDFAGRGTAQDANFYWGLRARAVAERKELETQPTVHFNGGVNVWSPGPGHRNQEFWASWGRGFLDRPEEDYSQAGRTTPIIPVCLEWLHWSWTSEPNSVDMPIRPNTSDVFKDVHFTPEGFVDAGIGRLEAMRRADEASESPSDFVTRLAEVLPIYVKNRRPTWYPTTLRASASVDVAKLRPAAQKLWGFKSIETYLFNSEFLNSLHSRLSVAQNAAPPPWVFGEVALVFHDTPSPVVGSAALRAGPGGFHRSRATGAYGRRETERHLGRKGANKRDGVLRASLVSTEREEDAEAAGAAERMRNAVTVVGTYETPGELIRDAFVAVERSA